MFATWERDFLVSFSSWSIDWTYLGKKATKWRCCNSVYSIYSCLFSIPYILCPFTPILTSSHPHTSCREMSPALSRCARYLRAFQVSNFPSFSTQPEVSEIPDFVVVTLQSRSLLPTSKMSQHQTPKKKTGGKKKTSTKNQSTSKPSHHPGWPTPSAQHGADPFWSHDLGVFWSFFHPLCFCVACFFLKVKCGSP